MITPKRGQKGVDISRIRANSREPFARAIVAYDIRLGDFD
jgi:hypothetical protein